MPATTTFRPWPLAAAFGGAGWQSLVGTDEHSGMTSFSADRETLRALADEGNEKALDRLADLAGERDDLDELNELLDEGCLRAGRLLTRRAAAKRDLRELQRLSDAGSTEAGDELDRLLDGPH